MRATVISVSGCGRCGVPRARHRSWHTAVGRHAFRRPGPRQVAARAVARRRARAAADAALGRVPLGERVFTVLFILATPLGTGVFANALADLAGWV